jgi:isopentenyldiphosphate isomerase/intracellular septation protein A
MDKGLLGLLVKMLPGLLPLLIFILVDAIWGTETGLIVAIVFGVGELLIILLKEKRLDWFVIFDTALLMLLGGISLISSDEIFFKLKPALINCIFLVIIGLSAFSNKNLLLHYSKRYLKDLEIKESFNNELRRTSRMMFWLFFVQTILILFSAFYLSKAAWGFISGGLLYILFGIYFGWQFLSNWLKKRKKDKEEWFPVVDDSGKIIGKATRKEVHNNKNLLHPVIHLHVMNRKGEIYLQKRPMNKDIQPGKWDTAVGGHINYGEQVEQALLREASEELGLENFTFRPLFHYRWNSPVESELVYSFVTVIDHQIHFNTDELSDGRFWRMNEIEQLIGKNILTPNFEHEFPLIKKNIL